MPTPLTFPGVYVEEIKYSVKHSNVVTSPAFEQFLGDSSSPVLPVLCVSFPALVMDPTCDASH
jgi:hypothetical protein